VRGVIHRAVLLLGFVPFTVAGALGQVELPKPSDRVILTITGSTANQNNDGKTELDAAALDSIGIARIQTSTPWTDGQPVFEGVLMRDLLNRVGVHGTTITVVALNDYKMQIPIADFTTYPVLLASKMNGEKLRIRDKGPLWLIYPQDEFPELKTKPTQAKWVWQVKEIQLN
jgi:hypothetical protein